MSPESTLVWHGMMRHETAASNIALVREKTLVQSSACRACEFDLEVGENHLRDGGVVASLWVV